MFRHQQVPQLSHILCFIINVASLTNHFNIILRFGLKWCLTATS